MSRSKRKTPIYGNTTADSEKKDKRLANRKLRGKVKIALNKNKEVPLLREVSNVWTFEKDGKVYFPEFRKFDK